MAAESTYGFLLLVPAWIGPLVALAAFLVLRYLLPAIFPNDPKAPVGLILNAVAPASAPFVGLGIVVLWILAEFQKRRRRKLLSSQSDLDSIRQLSWQEFEHLVGEAFRQSGYVVEERGGSGGDGGIDLVLTKGGERAIVQCKQWRTRKVGVKPIRELYGVLTSEKVSRALLITCGGFTKEAIGFAEGKPLELIDGPALWVLVGFMPTQAWAHHPEWDAPHPTAGIADG